MTRPTTDQIRDQIAADEARRKLPLAPDVPVVPRHPFGPFTHADGYALDLGDGLVQVWQTDGWEDGTVAVRRPVQDPPPPSGGPLTVARLRQILTDLPADYDEYEVIAEGCDCDDTAVGVDVSGPTLRICRYSADGMIG